MNTLLLLFLWDEWYKFDHLIPHPRVVNSYVVLVLCLYFPLVIKSSRVVLVLRALAPDFVFPLSWELSLQLVFSQLDDRVLGKYGQSGQRGVVERSGRVGREAIRYLEDLSPWFSFPVGRCECETIV